MVNKVTYRNTQHIVETSENKKFLLKDNCQSLQGGSFCELQCTVLPAKSDSDIMFWLQSYQGLIINISLVY